jgi:hypothetical protein
MLTKRPVQNHLFQAVPVLKSNGDRSLAWSFCALAGQALEQRWSLRLQGSIGKKLAVTTTGCTPGGERGGQRIKKEGVHSDSNLQFMFELCGMRQKQRDRVSGGLKRGFGGMG